MLEPGVANPPEISVVLLCYREGENIPKLVTEVEAEIQRLGVPYELVLVANYLPRSNDKTPQIASKVAERNPRVKVVARPKAGMMGWDMQTGLEAATGRILAVTDGDGQFPFSDIGTAYRELRRRNLDLCQTNRVKREDGWARVVLSKVYNFVFQLLFPGTGLHDVNSKPKVMTREAYQSLRLTSTDWFIDAEIVIQARRHGLRLGEIPSVFGKSEGRPSFVRPTAILEFVKNLFIARVQETLDRSRRTSRRP